MPLPPASARSRPRLLVSLAEAREQALTKRKLARSGGNPLAEKRRAEGMHTFADASRRVLDQKRGGWRGRWHAQNWLPASNATRSRALDPSTVGRPSDRVRLFFVVSHPAAPDPRIDETSILCRP